MRLLIVEHDLALRGVMTARLEEHGVNVTPVATAAAAVAALQHSAFDVAILDLQLPDQSGRDVLQAVRDLGPPCHVIVLGTGGSETDRVGAFELGADDYVVNPFFVRELTARVLAERRRRRAATSNTLRCGSIAIDLAARQVTVGDVPMTLTVKEFDLLAYFAIHPRHTFSRDELLRSVWHSRADWQQASTVTEHVRRLRIKFEQDVHQPRLLRTVRGIGYRFDPPADEPRDRAERHKVKPFRCPRRKTSRNTPLHLDFVQ